MQNQTVSSSERCSIVNWASPSSTCFESVRYVNPNLRIGGGSSIRSQMRQAFTDQKPWVHAATAKVVPTSTEGGFGKTSIHDWA
jgi:hypothetical protein